MDKRFTGGGEIIESGAYFLIFDIRLLTKKQKHMQRLYTLLMLLLALTPHLRGQAIMSMTVVPANPTPASFVEIHVDMMFPNSSCAGVAYHSINGNLITASTTHCMGMLTTTCNDVDTLLLGQLAAGTYTVIFSQSSGYGIPNCTPGFVADDEDTLVFLVGPLGINTPDPFQLFTVSPNPAADGTFQLNGLPESGLQELLIYDMNGRLLAAKQLAQGQQTISTGLPAGMYMLRVKSEGLMSQPKKLLITGL